MTITFHFMAHEYKISSRDLPDTRECYVLDGTSLWRWVILTEVVRGECAVESSGLVTGVRGNPVARHKRSSSLIRALEASRTNDDARERERAHHEAHPRRVALLKTGVFYLLVAGMLLVILFLGN